MLHARLDLSKLLQLPESHMLQSNLSLIQPMNTSPNNKNISSNIALLKGEVMESEKGKQNVIMFSLSHNDSFVRNKRMLHDLFLDLGCNDIMIPSIIRFGRQTIKPRPLRIKLRSQQNVLTLFKAAPKQSSLRNI